MAVEIGDKLEALGKQAVKLRDKDELAWHDVAGQLEASVGKVMLAYEFAKVAPGDRVTASTDAALGKKIAQLRDKDGLSWARIMARTGYGEQTCRRLYEDATGTSTKGNRIGKGGRHPGTGGAPAKKAAAKKAPAKKAVAKKAPGKRAPAAKKAAKKAPGKRVARKAASSGGGATAPNGAKPAIVDMDFDQLAERLEGRGIQVARSDGGTRAYKVRSVRGLENGTVEFIDATTGNVHSVTTDSIKKVSK
jgi:hypothetical protein